MIASGRPRAASLGIGSTVDALEGKTHALLKGAKRRGSTPVDGRYRSATVGTDKRERQRANKAVKEQQAARAETRQKGTRIGVIIVAAIVLLPETLAALAAAAGTTAVWAAAQGVAAANVAATAQSSARRWVTIMLRSPDRGWVRA